MISRRSFIYLASAALVPQATDQIIDIHQHTHYSGRGDEDLIAHQRGLGIAKTVLLPAGSKYGLEADCYGNDSVMAIARAYPKEFYFFANEVPDLPQAKQVLEKYLKAGAIGIGEQKFFVDCDSKEIVLMASIAREFDVPVLMHFQHEKYNTGFERFYKILEKFPRVNFIGHAQTFWGNIDRNLTQSDLYPKGKVTPGGFTDKWLSTYPNLYGDLSAQSGLNALIRDEDNARDFLTRHQNKLLFGSDCSDVRGTGNCIGTNQLATLRRLITDQNILRKILNGNATRVLKIK
jgi:Predicted metal-dependent hydrolase of the TIM-barrel fold